MKVVRVVSISIAVLVGLPLLIYVGLVVINWNDRLPSVTTKQFMQFLDELPVVADDDNAYVFMLGFASDPNVDPAALGKERQRWLISASANGTFDPDDDPDLAYIDAHEPRSDAVDALATTCKQSAADCFATIASDETAAVQWLADESWLVERYRRLIDYSDFRSVVPFDLLAPVPDYSQVFDGQRQFFVAAYLEARDGNIDHVLSQFDSDLAFWRRVLSRSDTLITKMVASAAIKYHFVWGNQLLRSLPQTPSRDTVPDSWLEAIADEERSMKRTLIGEWHFSANSLAMVDTGRQNPMISDYYAGPTWLETAGWYVLRPLFKAQDLHNRHAAMLATLIEWFDVPYDQIPDALAQAATASAEKEQRGFTAYNPIGNMVFIEHYKLFADYAVRVTDLEGIRRAAVLTSQLRAQQLTVESVGEALEAADLRDPYTGKAFTWQPETNSVVFRGLEASDHGEHRFAY